MNIQGMALRPMNILFVSFRQGHIGNGMTLHLLAAPSRSYLVRMID
jgi:hypothetical protein